LPGGGREGEVRMETMTTAVPTPFGQGGRKAIAALAAMLAALALVAPALLASERAFCAVLTGAALLAPVILVPPFVARCEEAEAEW